MWTLPAELAAAAGQLFGDRLELAVRYAELLATDGVLRGMVGPREAGRIWDRHLLNCAVVADLIPSGAAVVDVGSGAGLPGIVLAVARPDLDIALVEPLARRVSFLGDVIAALELPGVEVVRTRAEETVGRRDPADVVVARAVAPLDRLAGWCLPLLRRDGRLLAIKGASAEQEASAHAAAVVAAGGSRPVLRSCGVGVIERPTVVVEVQRVRLVGPGRGPSRGRRPGYRRKR